ncbi:zinc finger protein 70-like [Sycon ciliatum]|uniref:zinc finger protein 70-like n=1 Tax=Sycon ciliatum TaxID=27933 RepID=UPI0020ABFFA2
MAAEKAHIAAAHLSQLHDPALFAQPASSAVTTTSEDLAPLSVPYSAGGEEGSQKKTGGAGRLLQAFRVMSTEFVPQGKEPDEDEEYLPPRRKTKRTHSEPAAASSSSSSRARSQKRAPRASNSTSSTTAGGGGDQEDGEWSRYDDNGVTRYRCELCGKLFNNRSNLLRHLPNHWDKKPYECADCGRAFPRRGQLMQHIRSHQDDFPFKCPSCTKSFKWKQSLRRHHCNRSYAHLSRDIHHPRSNATPAPPPNARYLQSLIPIDAIDTAL